MLILLYKLLACHMLGDYVLQTDFLAKTKGENFWHMLAHCVLYTVPFALTFGIDMHVLCLMSLHLAIDSLKVRGHIGYAVDQAAHLLALVIYLF